MIGDDLYIYRDTDAPSSKINYSYSEFHGTQFLESWRTNRKKFTSLTDNQFEVQFENRCQTETTFEKWYANDFTLYPENYSSLLLLVKRFEVTKKIYDSYDCQFRPTSNSNYMNVRLYAQFGLVLIKAYNNTGFLPLLNALLKSNDILISLQTELDNFTTRLACHTIKEEIIAVDQLIKSLDEI